jgi:hypothetical protein
MHLQLAHDCSLLFIVLQMYNYAFIVRGRKSSVLTAISDKRNKTVRIINTLCPVNRMFQKSVL